jgi:monoamine oxidase
MSQIIEDKNVYDVIIVGAGISGSNAAYILKKRCKNLRILVVEAKDRTGGRTQTIELKCSKENKKSKWDIGGQWVCQSQKNVIKLINELNIETYRQYDDGKKLLEANGKVSVYNSSVPCSSFFSWIDMLLYMKRVNKHVKIVDPIYPYNDPDLAKELDSKTLKDYLFSKSLTSTVRSIFTSNMRTIHALELNQVNALFGLMYIKSCGGNVEAITYSDEGCAQEARVKGGTQQISEKCLEYAAKVSENNDSFRIIFNQAMIKVIQTDESGLTELITQNTQTEEKTSFKAKKIISSIPLNQYPNVKFQPELPYYKRNFHKFFQVGNYIKFVVTYKSAFWRSKGLSGEGTYDGSVMWLNQDRFNQLYRDEINKPSFNKQMPTIGAVAEVFDGSNHENEPALVGFIAAKAVVEWADQSDEVRKMEVIEDLARLYGPEARDYVDYCEKNWSYEPYNGGCPVLNVVAPGVMKDYARATREPFLNVHFCGTESATEWQGYMDGAVESGERVANEVLYTLYKNDPSVRVDYEKTFYFQKELIKKMNQNDLESTKAREKRQKLIKTFVKYSLVLGSSYFVLSKYLKSNQLPKLSSLFFK